MAKREVSYGKTIIITADLGHFKAYRITKDPPDIRAGREKLDRDISDKAALK